MGDKLLGYEKTRPSEITSPFCKYAKRNDENKEIKVWGQQEGNLFSILLCMKKEKAQARSKKSHENAWLRVERAYVLAVQG